MGCRIIAGTGDGTDEAAVFYCSTTMTAFGPVMNSLEEAEKFLEVSFVGTDPRKFNQRELADKYADFVTKWVCQCGTLRDPEGEAYEIAHDVCTCPNNGAGDCPYCEALSISADWEPEPGERYVCWRCQNADQLSA